MLSSLKKPSNAVLGPPAWHPNFRDPTRLPDTKVIRTSFFLNVLSVTVVLSLGIYVFHGEVKLRALRVEADAVRQSIIATKKGSDQAVALFAKFKEEEKKIQALESFLNAPPLVYSDFLLKLGSTLPHGIAFRGIDYRSTVVLLNGDIEGASDEASGQANIYVESLKNDPELKEKFEVIKLTSIVKDPGSGKMNFTIELNFKGAPAKKK